MAPGRRLGVHAAGVELDRVEEGLHQGDVVGLLPGHLAARAEQQVEPRHVLGQHGMAEAVDDVGELGGDARVDVDRVREQEGVGVRRDGAGELLENEMLVDHLRGEAAGLKQALAVPDQPVDLRRGRRHHSHVDQQPFVEECQIGVRSGQQPVLDFLDLAVVLVVEEVVDRGQADVLVAASVADDVVRIEKLVVVGRGNAILVWHDHVPGDVVSVGYDRDTICGGIAVVVDRARRNGGVCDVVQERTACRCRLCGRDGRGKIAFDRACPGDKLRQPVRAAHELAVEVGQHRRYPQDVRVGQLDAELLRRLPLYVRPGRRAAIGALQHVTRRHRLAVNHGVFPQEHLVRGIGGVDLIEVDPRRGLVGVLADIVGGAEVAVRAGLVRCPGQHHEVGRAAGNVERIVRLERHVDGAAAALADQIEPVIEELAEQREEAVERRGVAEVGGHVGDDDGIALEFDAEHIGKGLVGRRLVERLLRHGQRLRGGTEQDLSRLDAGLATSLLGRLQRSRRQRDEIRCICDRLVDRRDDLRDALAVGVGLNRGRIGRLLRTRLGPEQDVRIRMPGVDQR